MERLSQAVKEYRKAAMKNNIEALREATKKISKICLEIIELDGKQGNLSMMALDIRHYLLYSKEGGPKKTAAELEATLMEMKKLAKNIKKDISRF